MNGAEFQGEWEKASIVNDCLFNPDGRPFMNLSAPKDCSLTHRLGIGKISGE